MEKCSIFAKRFNGKDMHFLHLLHLNSVISYIRN